MAEDWTCIGGSQLSIGISRAPGVVGATLRGMADVSSLETILEAGLKLLDDSAAAVVWDLRGLDGVSGRGGDALVRVMREAQRLGKEVRLVGCGEAMARQLGEMGLRGDFWHYPSLVAATEGALREPGHGVTVYLRRECATRARLRLLVASLARPCGMDEEDQARVVVALDDVCGLAARAESGDREPLTLTFFAAEGVLTADVSWSIPPAHRDPEAIWARRPSARARVVASLDRVETLAQSGSVVIRLVRQTRGEAIPVEDRGGSAGMAAVLPDTLGRSAALRRRPESPPLRVGGRWQRWLSGRRLAFVAGLAGRSMDRGKGQTGGETSGQRE